MLFILAIFAWAGWANFEYRKQAAERCWPRRSKQGELVADAAGGEAAILTRRSSASPRPQFTLEDLSGKKVSLASYKGKAVLINFWATWCAPCKIETPWLIELRNQYAAQGFEILGVSADDIDRDEPAELQTRRRRLPDPPRRCTFLTRC